MVPKDSGNYCLSCEADLSSKRSDAKYCSARCRMRYKRQQEKNGLIEELARIFSQLPNHSAQCTGGAYTLQDWDAMEGNAKLWSHVELVAMSISELKALVHQKRWALAGTTLINLFKR